MFGEAVNTFDAVLQRLGIVFGVVAILARGPFHKRLRHLPRIEIGVRSEKKLIAVAVSVRVHADAIAEADETFTVELTAIDRFAAVGALNVTDAPVLETGLTRTAIGTIVNFTLPDDLPPDDPPPHDPPPENPPPDDPPPDDPDPADLIHNDPNPTETGDPEPLPVPVTTFSPAVANATAAQPPTEIAPLPLFGGGGGRPVFAPLDPSPDGRTIKVWRVVADLPDQTREILAAFSEPVDLDVGLAELADERPDLQPPGALPGLPIALAAPVAPVKTDHSPTSWSWYVIATSSAALAASLAVWLAPERFRQQSLRWLSLFLPRSRRRDRTKGLFGSTQKA